MKINRKLKIIRRSLFYSLLSAINTLMPKRSQVFVYGGSALYDNTEAMLEYLCMNTDVPVVCMADKYRDSLSRDGVRYINDNIFAAVWYLLTSRVAIDSFLHAVRMRPTRGQLFLQLWHGSPIKSIYQVSGEQNAQYYTYIAYPSEFFREVFAAAFYSPDNKLLLCGNPRNDLLLEPKLGRFHGNRADIRVIWMPTFRHGLGVEETKCDVPVVNPSNITRLDEFLGNRSIHLYVKPHPLQIFGFEQLAKECDNVELITDAMLREDGLPLYSFLGAMDVLLTDYSSVYFDYLLLNRPIGFVIDDFDEYASNRGFMFDDPMSLMPGPVLSTLDELICFLDICLEDDSYVEERRQVNELANHYRDGKNRERVADLIDQFLAKGSSDTVKGVSA